MDLGLEGRVALVMGASTGLGRAVAASLSAEGARVAACSRSRERIDEAVAGLGGEAQGFVADASDPSTISGLAERVVEALGPIEILVLNTGGPPFGGALDGDDQEWERAYQALLTTPRTLCGAVVPAMRERGWGRIVNVGSSATREPIPGLALSTVHRMAAVGFLHTLAREVAGDGITVNTVAPGAFDTSRLRSMLGGEESAAAVARQIPTGRLGRPEEYGDLVAFICSQRAGYLTGGTLLIDGGRSPSVG